MEKKAQVVIIGAGPAGYPAAFHAADHGLDVVLVDREENPGGVCLYRGCIPSKALLHVAGVIEEARAARAWGVTFAPPTLDLDGIRAWKQSVVEKLTGGLGHLSRQRKIRYVRGAARLTGADQVEVATAEGVTVIQAEHIVLASGSRPATLPGLPATPRIMDSTQALELPEIPRRLLIVGGGYIGLELGQAYAALGAEVSVCEVLETLLTGADRDLAQVLARRLQRQCKEIMLGTRLEQVRESAAGLEVTLQAPDGQALTRAYDRLLVSVGRTPCAADLNLAAAGLAAGARGFVPHDAQGRTASRNIFAVGDVAGQPMLAHKATAEAKAAIDALRGLKVEFAPRAIPAVVFTQPEIAWCGLTEQEAADRQMAVEIGRFPWAASGRALTLGGAEGLTKLIVEPGTRRILGMGLAGPGAGELIAEGVLAVEMGAVAEDLALTIHPHPTLSETIMEAAESLLGQATHFLKREPKGA
ncbi:MAG: dihydrolipoyl dehydrogenase [Candidatus Marinimicrobia bacterium]|nr:dihydrolipoyl dehydrogenase [Candidatus Neomarinimicrobiota bacterium]